MKLEGYTLRKDGTRKRERRIKIVLPESSVLKIMEMMNLNQKEAEKALVKSMFDLGYGVEFMKYAVAKRTSNDQVYNNEFSVISLHDDFDSALEASDSNDIVVEVSDNVKINDSISENGYKWEYNENT